MSRYNGATITDVIEGISVSLCNSCFKSHHFCQHKGKKVCPIIDEFKRSAYEPYKESGKGASDDEP